MVSAGLLITYAGLPRAWADEDEMPSATIMKLEKVSETLRNSDRGGTVFVKGNPATLFQILWEDSLKEFKGVSFPEYFDNKMSKETNIDFIPAKFTFVYDVGIEGALNKQFSGQLLKQLITKCENDRVWCFICSDIPKQKFQQEYGIEIKNNINLPNKTKTTLL